MAILACILVMLAVTLVPTLRSYLQQQNEYSALQAKVTEQRRTVDAADPRAGRSGTTPPTSSSRSASG